MDTQLKQKLSKANVPNTGPPRCHHISQNNNTSCFWTKNTENSRFQDTKVFCSSEHSFLVRFRHLLTISRFHLDTFFFKNRKFMVLGEYWSYTATAGTLRAPLARETFARSFERFLKPVRLVSSYICSKMRVIRSSGCRFVQQPTVGKGSFSTLRS